MFFKFPKAIAGQQLPPGEVANMVFSPKVQAALEQQRIFEQQFDLLDPTQEGITFGAGGRNHRIAHFTWEGKRYVVKKLRNDSREHLSFGLGVLPQEVDSMDNSSITEIRNPERIANYMRLAHGVITAYIGSDLITPTAILVRGNNIYRVQPDVPDLIDPTYRRERAVRLEGFYSGLQEKWRNLIGSSDFHSLPHPVRAFYEHFGLDRGDGSNTVYNGLFHSPEFQIFDY